MVVLRRTRPTRISDLSAEKLERRTYIGKEYIKLALFFQSLFADVLDCILVCGVGLLGRNLETSSTRTEEAGYGTHLHVWVLLPDGFLEVRKIRPIEINEIQMFCTCHITESNVMPSSGQ